MKDKIILHLVWIIGAAICLAIVGDFITAALETQATGEAVEISSEVITLCQTALGGLIGVIGGYFGSKAQNKKEDE